MMPRLYRTPTRSMGFQGRQQYRRPPARDEESSHTEEEDVPESLPAVDAQISRVIAAVRSRDPARLSESFFGDDAVMPKAHEVADIMASTSRDLKR
ncbi:hypothetical protein KIPB_000980 [Kipferlia bialata]|uniref:Uncharacterized protein n=1 Tax=Kipferlia bialata TaxID=797122 RepID=A0A9K3GEV3_9EUKA|nr:hypothetical protein KIPB_000980 [Kipferlia bialata]|eukprot:g980.t1